MKSIIVDLIFPDNATEKDTEAIRKHLESAIKACFKDQAVTACELTVRDVPFAVYRRLHRRRRLATRKALLHSFSEPGCWTKSLDVL